MSKSGVFSDIAEVNPRSPAPAAGQPVSFIAMADVTEQGVLDSVVVRNATAGYTPFVDGDVLVAKITPCLENGKGAHVRDLPVRQGQGSTEFHVLRALPGTSDRYLYHLTRSADFRLRAEGLMTGSAGQRRVPTEFFHRYQIRIPSLSEQQRIAEVLDTIDDTIRAAERIIEKYQLLRTGILGATVWKTASEREPSKALGDIAEGGPRGMAIGPFGSDLTASDYRATGTPVFFVRDVRANEPLEHRSKVFVTKEKAKSLRAHEVIEGDVVITKMGLPPGVAAIHTGDVPNGVITADLIRFRPDRRHVDPTWVALAINGPPVRRQVDCITAGVTRPKVTLKDFRMMALSLPALDVQVEQVGRIRAVDDLVTIERASLTSLQAIRSGLARDLLSGRVRTVTT